MSWHDDLHKVMTEDYPPHSSRLHYLDQYRYHVYLAPPEPCICVAAYNELVSALHHRFPERSYVYDTLIDVNTI